MATAEELIVAITSEGVSETRDDLEGVESAMEDTADSAGDSAEELEGFSQRFQGAMSAAIAGLAVGAAGLLSQVPVIGELMAGLFSIIEAVAFQMDGVLRPVLSPLTDAFFDFANAIFEADGIAGDIIGVIASFISIGAVVLATIVGVVKILSVFAGAIATVGGALGTIISVVGAVASTLAGLLSLPALLIAAFVALAAALIFNVGGIRDTVIDILGDMWDWFVDLASDLTSWASDLASDAWDWGSDAIGGMLDAIRDVGSGVFEWFTDLGDDLASWAGDLADSAFDWGVGIIESLIDGISRALDFASDTISDIATAVGIDLEMSSVPDFGRLNANGSGGGTSTGASSRPRFGAGRATSTRGQQIDGRQISESTGRYRADPSNRRGL